MAESLFRFKKFEIRQDRSAFKVGTDAVLLGAWADVAGSRTVLDIGTGTGLLALMIAQRSKASITAIEIDDASFHQALENVSNSPWENRIRVLNQNLQDYKPYDKFDLILSNPPFFQDSLRPEDESKRISRHDSLLSLEELAVVVPRLMMKTGKLCLILPVTESWIFERLAGKVGLNLYRSMEVRPAPSLEVKRRLMEFRFQSMPEPAREELIIEEDSKHRYTKAYWELTKDFYLDF